MARYIVFKSAGESIVPGDCTTPWSSTVTCNIALTGVHTSKHHNLMVMEESGSGAIDQWLADNVGKVTEATEAEATALGKLIAPNGVGSNYTCPHCGTTVADTTGVFDIVTGQSHSTAAV